MRDSEHILVVDDQLDNITIMERMLLRAGYRVSWADSGAAALEFLTHSIPDLILLDIMMPHMDGYATLHAIRENPRLPFIPIMFVSAKQTVADTVTGLDSGADDYLVKPVNREELLARMRVQLRLKQTRRELQREQDHLRRRGPDQEGGQDRGARREARVMREAPHAHERERHHPGREGERVPHSPAEDRPAHANPP